MSNFSENDPRKTQCFQHWGVKREVFWPPVFRKFQHSQLFSTLFFTVFQYFSLLNSKRAQSEISIKKLLCSSTEYKHYGRIGLNLHVHFYCIPVRFFHWIPAFLQPLFSLKPYCVPAPNTRKAEGFGLICTHILTWFQHGACVSTSCIPALTASLLRYPSPLKNVRRYCILA